MYNSFKFIVTLLYSTPTEAYDDFYFIYILFNNLFFYYKKTKQLKQF